MKPRYKTPKPSFAERFLGHFYGYDAYYYKAIGGHAIFLQGESAEYYRVISDWKAGSGSLLRADSYGPAFDGAILEFENGDSSISPNARMS